MCEFVSWIEDKNGNVFFLQDSDLKGKKFSEYKKYNKNWQEDIRGHGAIEYFYPELLGNKHCECINFSNSDNFPAEIIEAIKKLKLTKYGINLELLNDIGKAEYEKIKQSALAEYEKIKQSAWAEYEKIKQSAWAEHKKIVQSALAEYKKIVQSALAKYEKIKQSALAEYEKIQQSAWAEYIKIVQLALTEYIKIKRPALAEYEKIQQSAWAEYEKIKQSVFWQVFANKKYRNSNWI